MEQIISATVASRKFSLLLRGVREGRSYLVTSRGKPVARLIPAGRHEDADAGAREALLRRLATQSVLHLERLARDEFYQGER